MPYTCQVYGKFAVVIQFLSGVRAVRRTSGRCTGDSPYYTFPRSRGERCKGVRVLRRTLGRVYGGWGVWSGGGRMSRIVQTNLQKETYSQPIAKTVQLLRAFHQAEI